jgi:hypothetical protein
VLRGWFTSIAATVDESTVRFVARRRVTRGGRMLPRSQAQVDRRDWVRYVPLARRVGPRYREWTRPEIIGALQAWADEHGRSPRWSDLDKQREDCPSPQTVQRHFGSWEAALDAAGLEPQPRVVGPHRVWSKQEVVVALVQWAAEHDESPASGDWRRGAPERPCSKTVCVHFGSWQAAVTAAGLTGEPRKSCAGVPFDNAR